MLRFLGEREESDLVLRLRQLLACISILLGSILAGLGIGYSAVLLPQLRTNSTEEEGFHDLSSNDLSWIASSIILSMLAASWLGGFLIEKIGRRWALLAIYPMNFFGWLVICLADGYVGLIIGRLICGVGIGAGGAYGPVYLVEISDPVLRGFLLSTLSSGAALGILLIHSFGLLLHWRTAAYVCAAFSVVCWITCVTSRESPTWLLNNGDTDRALESWVYLRGCKSLDEYLALENSAAAERKTDDDRSALADLKGALTSRHFLCPLGIVCAYFFISQFNGSTIIIYYSVDMLTELFGPDYADVGTLVADLTRLLFTVFASYLINFCKRRTLTFLSGFVTAATLLALAVISYYDVGRPWLPMTLLAIAALFIAIGMDPLPWVLCGELFSRKFRGLGSGLAVSCCYLCSFVTVKCLPEMFDTLQQYGFFVVYGVITLSGTVFLYYTLPETKGMVLQDVERSFDKKAADTNVRGDAEIHRTSKL